MIILADVRMYLDKLNPSTILLDHSLESDLDVLQLAQLHSIDTVLLFHHVRERPLEENVHVE